jgi:hypothetical protein
VLKSEVFEKNVIKALEDYIQCNGQVHPLSEDFFHRIEALKQKAQELQNEANKS